MTKSTTKTPAAKPEQPPSTETVQAKRPTPEQLQTLRRGGSYTFNAGNGSFGKRRPGTLPAISRTPKPEAK